MPKPIMIELSNPPTKEFARALRSLFPEYDPKRGRPTLDDHVEMAYRHGQQDVRRLVEAWANGDLDEYLGLVKSTEDLDDLLGNLDDNR